MTLTGFWAVLACRDDGRHGYGFDPERDALLGVHGPVRRDRGPRGSAIADFVPCWECIKFSRSVGAAWVQRCECPEAGERSSRYSIASNLGTFATDAAQPEG